MKSILHTLRVLLETLLWSPCELLMQQLFGRFVHTSHEICACNS